MWKTFNNNLQRPLFDGTREKRKQGFITTQQSAACCKSQESQPKLGEGREAPPAAAAAAATKHGGMSNSSQMRELGGLVDNLYLSSKNRHHQDVTASAPTTQSRKNTKVGSCSCSAQACPHEGGVASRWRCVGEHGTARCAFTGCVCHCAAERDEGIGRSLPLLSVSGAGCVLFPLGLLLFVNLHVVLAGCCCCCLLCLVFVLVCSCSVCLVMAIAASLETGFEVVTPVTAGVGL